MAEVARTVVAVMVVVVVAVANEATGLPRMNMADFVVVVMVAWVFLAVHEKERS